MNQLTESKTTEVPGPVSPAAAGKPGLRSWTVFAVMTILGAGTSVAMFAPITPLQIGLLASVLMLALMFLRMPISFAMIVPSLMGMYALRGPRLVFSVLSFTPFNSVASWELSVLPMFIFMGILLWRAGFTDTLYKAGNDWLGWLPGGLAAATNVAGAGLAAVSGSTAATTYAIARIGIPAMLKAGYDKRIAVGSVITAGLPGQLFPCSILLVVYAGIAAVPVGPQLLAGLVPGILMTVMFTAMIVVFGLVRPQWVGRGEGQVEAPVGVTWRERFTSLAGVWPLPMIIGAIFFGLYSGIFTSTEAGGMAALLSIVVMFIWKRGKGVVSAVRDAATSTVVNTGSIFLMLIGVNLLSAMLNLTGISKALSEVVAQMHLDRVGFLLFMFIVYLLLGTVMEALPMMMVTVPILIPTLQYLDISLLWFGVFTVFMAEIAIAHPPAGILAFIIHSITKDPEVSQGQNISLTDIFMATLYFIPMAVVIILILIFFPEIATFIPDLSASNSG